MNKAKIKKLEKELEDKIYNEGLYRKRFGSWDIKVEFDEDLTQDCEDDREEGENQRIGFKATATCSDEDGGHSDWWRLIVEVDKKYKIIEIERY